MTSLDDNLLGGHHDLVGRGRGGQQWMGGVLHGGQLFGGQSRLGCDGEDVDNFCRGIGAADVATDENSILLAKMKNRFHVRNAAG